jgi:uncharacterized MnhB-related membrane protein
VTAALLLDSLLLVLLLGLAWASLASRNLLQGIMLFVAFGLMLAIAWIRLGAADVALAEAAIGAGITGALLLATLGRLDAEDDAPQGTGPPSVEGKHGFGTTQREADEDAGP